MIIIAIALIGLIIIIIVYIIQSGKTKRTEILSGKTPPGKKKKIIGKQLKKETKNNASILHKYIKNKIKQ